MMIPEMPEIFQQVQEGFAAKFRERTGLDKMSPEQLFKFAYTLVCTLPEQPLQELQQRLAGKGSTGAEIEAREIAILLFARRELLAVHNGLTPTEVLDVLREMITADGKPAPV